MHRLVSIKLAVAVLSAGLHVAAMAEPDGNAATAKPAGVLSSWACAWSPYTQIDEQGRLLRLAKATITLPSPPLWGATLAIETTTGTKLASEEIRLGAAGNWAHGFWLPETNNSQLVVKLIRDGGILEEMPADIAAGPAKVSLPLRIDMLDRSLAARLAARERTAIAASNGGVEHLRQHDVVYLEPSASWVEGLPVGNGSMGGLVAGIRGREQSLFLDKTDIWLATAEGAPLGRSTAGTLRIRYASSGAAFEQRLALGRAEVSTRDGDYSSVIRVDANRDCAIAQVTARNFEIVLERPPVPLLWQSGKDVLWDRSASRLYGSWTTGLSAADLDALRDKAAKAPSTKVAWGSEGQSCWFAHTAPNITVGMAVTVDGGTVVWRQDGDRMIGTVTASSPVQIGCSIATSRQTPGDVARFALEESKACFKPPDETAHLAWWRAFWSRSWIEMPDKLEENLWYIGLYQQACVARADQATSFFGLFHPLDLRTWSETYTADAQVGMIWWLTFEANHLELLYPSHRTFGRMASDFVKRTPGEGMVVPHETFPPYAGGNKSYSGFNQHKGSAAWYVLNFWWDYMYSGDLEFLRGVAYPMMRMVADYFATSLVKGADGRYHCLDSDSPEQHNTKPDNIYDWNMITSLFQNSIKAASILEVDAAMRAEWRDRLDHLFEMPVSDGSVAETVGNPHPYRCHPVVLFGLYPANVIPRDTDALTKFRKSLDLCTKLFGVRYQDRHATIPGFTGGVEPNGFASGIMTITAARLGDPDYFRQLFYGLIVAHNMKQNGLRALNDPRQSDDISQASLVEAANAHTVATTQRFVQSWPDQVRFFPCIEPKGVYRFAGLRAEGGFVCAGEARDGNTRWLVVQALADGVLRFHAPASGLALRGGAPGDSLSRSDNGFVLRCKKGERYELVADPSCVVDLHPAASAERHEPRTVSIETATHQGRQMLEYPHDLPFGQSVRDANLYLGRPASYAAAAAFPPLAKLADEAGSPRWQDRQEAARLLFHATNRPRALELLDKLCADGESVVAHTAAVSLVRLGTPESLAIASRHASANRVPGLQREVTKAIGRQKSATK